MKSEIPPSLPDSLPAHLKDLAGLIARSHGIPLRDTFPYFSNFAKNKRALTHNTHPVYLMALLRIADFLQIDHTRATDLSAVRKLHSPLSQLNWQSHAALEDATWDEDDADADACRCDGRKLARILGTFAPDEKAHYQLPPMPSPPRPRRRSQPN